MRWGLWLPCNVPPFLQAQWGRLSQLSHSGFLERKMSTEKTQPSLSTCEASVLPRRRRGLPPGNAQVNGNILIQVQLSVVTKCIFGLPLLGVCI